MSRSVILPGSYDPVTVGHLAVIREAVRLYDEVFVVAFINPEKEYLFSPEERLYMLRIATEGLGVTVDYSEGLVIDYMKAHGIKEILKGYRNDTDLEYERNMAEWNRLHGGVETRLLKCDREYEKISSSAVRESISRGVVPREMLPPGVVEFILKRSI
jgi:pantetheine-phosphate adenylyltransferase